MADDCPNTHGPDAIIACWSPGGPCPDGRTECELCGRCANCTADLHSCGYIEGTFACKIRHLHLNTGDAKSARD